MRRQEDFFTNPAGLRLLERAWLPEERPRGVVAIVHGYAEHSGRYEHVGAFLAERGFAVHAFDLRGHGRSEGPRVLVRSFDEYLDDLRAFLARLDDRYPATPQFLLGHSMGGTIVALAAVTMRPQVAGILLSGAGLSVPARESLMIRGVVFAGRVLPRLPFRSLDAATVSSDPEVVARYDSDPLVYRGKMPLGTTSAMIRAVRFVAGRMERVTDRLLIMHGTNDELVSPKGSIELYRRAGSEDKTLRLYEGFAHEILNEPQRADVLTEIVRWIDARVPAPAQD